MRGRAVMLSAVCALVAVGAIAGCTQPEPLVTSDPDFCNQLIAGVGAYTDFAGAVLAGTEVTAAERDVAASYVAALEATAPGQAGEAGEAGGTAEAGETGETGETAEGPEAELAAALTVFTTPFEMDRHAQGQEDTAPTPIDAEALTAATSTLLTACATT